MNFRLVAVAAFLAIASATVLWTQAEGQTPADAAPVLAGAPHSVEAVERLGMLKADYFRCVAASQGQEISQHCRGVVAMVDQLAKESGL